MAGYSEEWVDVQKITFTRVRSTDVFRVLRRLILTLVVVDGD